MIGWFLAGVALLLIALALVQWLSHAKPADVLAFVRGSLLIVGAGLFIALLLSGRLLWALATLPAMLPWLIRLVYTARGLRALWQLLGGGRSVFGTGAPGAPPPTGQVSEVETRFFQMRLDHDTGDMDGLVREGQFAGRRLTELSLAELLALRNECWDEGDSLQLLEAFMDRNQGDQWRAADQADENGSSTGEIGVVDSAAAWKILGLEPGASAADIKAAHLRLMTRIHPDHGGSSYLAAQINRAREVLLEEVDRQG